MLSLWTEDLSVEMGLEPVPLQLEHVATSRMRNHFFTHQALAKLQNITNLFLILQLVPYWQVGKVLNSLKELSFVIL